MGQKYAFCESFTPCQCPQPREPQLNILKSTKQNLLHVAGNFGRSAHNGPDAQNRIHTRSLVYTKSPNGTSRFTLTCR